MSTNYTPPQFTLTQSFELVTEADLTPLHACILGPQYDLHRIGEDDEAYLGAVDKDNTQVMAWPALKGDVDLNSSKLWAKDSLIKYLESSAFSGPAVEGMNELTSSITLKSKGDYGRDAILGSRDVSIGDTVFVSWNNGTEQSIQTKVIGLEAEQVNAISPMTSSINNQTGSATVAPTVSEDTVSDAFTFTPGGSYSNLKQGVVTETYLMTVIKAGAIDVAECSIDSASGLDSVETVLITDGMLIGTNGVVLGVADGGVFAVGETITIEVQEAYNIPTITSGGVFTGTTSTEYLMRITEGGVLGTDEPKFKITTSNGIDLQSETVLEESNLVGNYGAIIEVVDAAELCKGDVYVFKATAEADRAIRTIKTAKKLTGCSASDTVTVVLALKDTVEIPEVYLQTTTEQVTVLAGISVEDTYLGLDSSLEVLEGSLVLDYRSLLTSDTEMGSVISDASVLGPVTPANPLAFAISKALEQSKGVAVYYVPVVDDSADGYMNAFAKLSNSKLQYGIVPLTKDAATLDRLQAAINVDSSPLNGKYRCGWFNANPDEVTELLATTATITDPDGGSNYIQVDIKEGSLIDAEVVAGDYVNSNYTMENGKVVYSSYKIAQIVDEDTCILDTKGADIPNAIKAVFVHARSNSELAEAIRTESNQFGDRRIRNVWPDKVSVNGELVEGYFLCAALAGLRSLVAPHAPLSMVEVSGFDATDRSNMFTYDQLNTIASGGTWIVMTSEEGAVFTRHQLTTNMIDINRREDSVNTNLDSISAEYRAEFDNIVGKSNVSDELLALLETKILVRYNVIISRDYSIYLGPQLQGYRILKLARDLVLRDKIKIKIKPEMPYPLNDMDMEFLLG